MDSSPLRSLLARLGIGHRSPFAWARKLGDAEWFEAHSTLASEAAPRDPRHHNLPALPTPEQQMRFTGCSGAENLQQAFHFYRFCLDVVSEARPLTKSDRILDFGCGWGRLARFWLRDVHPDQIWCIDCMTYAIELIQSTRIPVNILKNDLAPPVAGLPSGFRLIYAFSVFSHLSEAVALQWIDYFAGRLKPGGHLIFTTMGENFIATLGHLRKSPAPDFALQRTLELAPAQEDMETRYRAGEFVFFGTGGGGELTEDFYGNAIIPEAWLRKLENRGLRFCGARQDLEGINQTVVVLQKV